MKLTVIQNSVNLTLKMDNLSNPAKVIDLTTGEIYLGFHKPLKHFYIEMELSDPEVDRTLAIQYFNGDYVDVPLIEDRTFGFNRSGFVIIGELDQKKTTYSGKEMFWLKLSLSTPGPVSINGINLVLSDDTDFGLIPNIMDYLPDGATSFIGFHQEARNIILQKIRNSGKRIRESRLDTRLVDQFDILEIEEFRQASKYMALHLLYDFLSKGDEDQYAVKAETNLLRSEDSMNSRLIGIDENDNGKSDSRENQSLNSIRVKRE